MQSEAKVPKGRRRRKREQAMSVEEMEKLIVELEEEMLAAADELRFEYAARLRDEIRDLNRTLDDVPRNAPTGRRAGPAAALVRRVPARPAVAADDRSIRDPRQRGHAPADAGGAGRAALRAL